MIVFVGGAAFHVTSITGKEWGISIALGFVSIPLGALIRCIPNGPCERLFIMLHILPNPASLLPTAKEPTESAAGKNWNYAIDRVTDNLGTFANVRGGRMRGSSFVDRSRSAPGGTSDARPQMYVTFFLCYQSSCCSSFMYRSALMAMVPTLVASTVGARWAPAPSEGLSDPGNHDPSRSTAQLWMDKIEVHPDTKPDDFAYKRWGRPKTDV
jgi:Ca2+-transporting ATPase